MKTSKIMRVMAAALCGGASNSVWLSPQPPIRQIVRGEYQDKIRRYSPPQKIFSVFATMDENKKCTMSVHDLLRAICFYNYATSENIHNKDYKPQHIIQLLGKDDKFDIYDYFNFVRFISFSNDQLRSYFNQKNISSLNENRFVQLMLQYVCNDYDQFIRKPIYLQSRQFKPNKQQYYNAVKQMSQSLFKDRRSFTLDEMIRFRFDLMRELYTFEFRSFKLEDQSIDGVDFARSIVKYGENNHKRQLLRRIFWIQERVKDIKIKQVEYVNFHMQLQTQLDEFEKILNARGAINRKELRAILTQNIKLITQDQVDIFFSLLDVDDSHFLEKKEVFGVIKKLGYYWKVKPGENNLSELLKKRGQSFLNKSKRLIDILLQQ